MPATMFTPTDFLAYLSSGSLMLALLIAKILGPGPLQDSPPISVTVLLLLGAYIMGHVVGEIARLLESGLDRVVGHPRRRALGDYPSARGARLVARLVGAGKAFPDEIVAKIEEASRRNLGEDASSHAVFVLVFGLVRADPLGLQRTERFDTLYSFCRNCAVSTFLVGISLVIRPDIGGHDVRTGGVVLLAAAAALFRRYVRFRRLYFKEFYRSYLVLADRDRS